MWQQMLGILVELERPRSGWGQGGVRVGSESGERDTEHGVRGSQVRGDLRGSWSQSPVKGMVLGSGLESEVRVWWGMRRQVKVASRAPKPSSTQAGVGSGGSAQALPRTGWGG